MFPHRKSPFAKRTLGLPDQVQAFFICRLEHRGRPELNPAALFPCHWFLKTSGENTRRVSPNTAHSEMSWLPGVTTDAPVCPTFHW